jgi:hypothetical protein
MYKFVTTLTDSAPWISHFKKQAETTTNWRARPSNTVIILPDDIKTRGVEDPTKIQTVTPIEQISKQAEAALTQEIRDDSKNNVRHKKKRQTVTPKKKKTVSAVKRKVGAITKHTQDIFTDSLKKKKKSEKA